MKVNLVSTFLILVRKFRLIHLHWSAIDHAAAAMICQLAVNRLPNGKSSLPLPVTFFLGLTVFVTSSVNRLLDNRKPARTEMKQFLPNQKNRITFLEIVAGGLVLAVFLFFYLPDNLWKVAAGLSIISGILVWLASCFPEKSNLHGFRVPVSALLFTAGILAGVIFSKEEISKEIRYTGILFFLTICQHYLLTACYLAVEHSKTANLASLVGLPQSGQILHVLTFLVLAGGTALCLQTEFRYTQRLTVVLMLMSSLHSILLLNSGFMQHNKYRGMLITLVLLIPFLIL